VDTTLNGTIKLKTGCLKPTPIDKLQMLSGIALRPIKRKIAIKIEKEKQINNDRRVMYGLIPIHSRLKSRKYFINTTSTLRENSIVNHIEVYKE